MRPVLLLPLFLILSACATLTADGDQEITVDTTPPAAHCSLKNNAGSWKIKKTPGSVRVQRNFSPLVILCELPKHDPQKEILRPATRARAYGNILLLGVPALVDAYTGAGYEYRPDKVKIMLTPSKKIPAKKAKNSS